MHRRIHIAPILQQARRPRADLEHTTWANDKLLFAIVDRHPQLAADEGAYLGAGPIEGKLVGAARGDDEGCQRG